MNIAIIGGGPGGYVAAIKASQLGFETVLIEKENIGGTCVNKGCIPTKALLKGIHPLIEDNRLKQMGVNYSNLSIDIDKLRNHKNKALMISRQGIELLLKKYNVKLIRGTAREINNRKIAISAIDGKNEEVSFDKLILAMGSDISSIKGLEIDGNRIISSDEALELRKIPEKLLIVGGGAIGIEFATIYKALGSDVTIVEMMNQVLPGEDNESVEILKNCLIKLGIKIVLDCKIENVIKNTENIEVFLNKNGEAKEEYFDTILIATGRKPKIIDEIIKPLNIEYSLKGITTDNYLNTNNPDIYAIGDINGKSMLAHTAYTEAKIAVDRIFGNATNPIIYDLMPRCIFSTPEFASVGVTNSTKSYTFPYAANGRARASNIRDGLIKIFVENEKIIGGTIVGENASDMISFITLCISESLGLKKLAEITFPHPTFSEIIGEDIEVALGRPLHI
jgi:dihydrolipoamide dehydrogenase